MCTRQACLETADDLQSELNWKFLFAAFWRTIFLMRTCRSCLKGPCLLMRNCVVGDIFINCTCAGWGNDLSSSNSSSARKGLGVSGHYQPGVRDRRPAFLVEEGASCPCPLGICPQPGTAVKRTLK